MEVANLSVKLSADVEQAIAGLHKSDAAIQKSAKVSGSESKKMEGFMGKTKMGYMALAAGAMASMYAIAKSSTVISAYFMEFGEIVGTIFDSIGIALAPIMDPILDFLWKLSDAFEHLPAPIRGTIGIIIAIGATLMAIIPIVGLLVPTFVAGLAIIKAAFISLTVIMLANPIILVIMGIIAAIALLYFAWDRDWGGIREKGAKVFDWFKKHDLALLFLGPIGAVVLLGKRIRDNWDTIKEGLYVTAKTFSGIRGYFTELAIILGEWKDKAIDIWDRIKEKILEWVDIIKAKFSEWKDKIIEKLKTWKEAAIGLILSWIAKVKEKFRGWKDAIVTKVTEWKDIIITKIREWKDKIISFFSEWKDKIAAKISEWKIILLEKFEAIKTKIYEWKDKIIEIKDIIIAKFTEWKDKILTWKDTIVGYWETLKTKTETIWNGIKDAIWTPIESAWFKVEEFVDKIISKIKSIPIIGSVTSYITKTPPEYQHGGYVPTTGLAMLHAGEYITPASDTRNMTNSPTIVISPTIYVSGEMRTDTDLRKLASDLTDYLDVYFNDKIKRMVRG